MRQHILFLLCCRPKCRSVPDRNFFCRVAVQGTGVRTHTVAGNEGSPKSDVDWLLACGWLGSAVQRVLFTVWAFQIQKKNHNASELPRRPILR